MTKHRAMILAWDAVTGQNRPFMVELPRYNGDQSKEHDHLYLDDALGLEIAKAMGEEVLEPEDRFTPTNFIHGVRSSLIEWTSNEGVYATTHVVWLNDDEVMAGESAEIGDIGADFSKLEKLL